MNQIKEHEKECDMCESNWSAVTYHAGEWKFLCLKHWYRIYLLHRIRFELKVKS